MSVEPAGAVAGGDRRVDVLEVDVDDAVAVVGDERDGVAAADQQMAGVEAPADVGSPRQPLDVGGASRSACRRAGAAASVSPWAATRAPRSPPGCGRAAANCRVVERRRRRPAGVRRRARHTNTSAPAPASQAARASSAAARASPSAGSWSTSGTKPPTSASPWASSRSRSAPGSRGASRAGRAPSPSCPSPAISASTRSGGSCSAPARHLAHAPRDRRAGQPPRGGRTVLVPRRSSRLAPHVARLLVWSAPRN